MLFGLLMTLGVFVLSIALRSYQTSFAQKAGALGILTASFLAVYFVTRSYVYGVLGALSWLFLPWLEILTRIRALRLPKEKRLRPRVRRRRVYPSLMKFRTRSRSEGFAHISDAGWDWEDYRQFFRLYYKEEDRSQATICLNEQNDLSFYYLRISSRARTASLDDLELSALLWTAVDPDISDQSSTAGPIILAAVPEPPRIFARAQRRARGD